jgi:hypothetical protein
MQLVELDGRTGKVRFVYDTPQGKVALIKFDQESFVGDSFDQPRMKFVPLSDLEPLDSKSIGRLKLAK